MPGLILFNRRWHIGSDDFVYRGVLEILFRTAWSIALSVVYVIHRKTFTTCEKGMFLEIFYIGMIGLNLISMLLTLAIVCLSARGTIADDRPRRLLPTALYLKLVFGFIVECIFLVVSAYWAFGDKAECDDEVVTTLRVAMIMGLLVIIFFLLSIGLFFDPLGGKARNKQSDLAQSSTAVWTNRCGRLCCCMERDANNKDSLITVARIVANFFTGIDLVPTDIAAGFILLEEDQDRRGVDEGYQLSPSDTMLESGEDPASAQGSPSAPIEDWLDINRMIRYLKFAQAAFGWPMYIVLNDCSGPCTLAKYYKCCQRPEVGGELVDDNCCQCNLAALRLTVEIPETDIIYATYHNKLFEVPFYVAYDHEQKAVVVASRGLLSLEDTVVSLTLETESIDFSELPDEDNQAHKGILESAKYIKSELDRLKLLERAFEEHPDYQLILTGYSLGAGLSACLAILYHSQYPGLKAYAFAVPPVLTPAISRYAQAFICSVVLAKDMVPRLSLVNMEDLKLKVLRQIKYSTRPKYQILASGIWHILCGCPKATSEAPPSGSEEKTTDQEPSHISQVNLTEAGDESWVDGAIANCERDIGTHRLLNVPGKIMRIIQVGNNEFRYLLWTKQDDLREIIVNPKMLWDHLPTRMLAAFQFLVDNKQTPLDHLPSVHLEN